MNRNVIYSFQFRTPALIIFLDEIKCQEGEKLEEGGEDGVERGQGRLAPSLARPGCGWALGAAASLPLQGKQQSGADKAGQAGHVRTMSALLSSCFWNVTISHLSDIFPSEKHCKMQKSTNGKKKKQTSIVLPPKGNRY